MMPCTVTVDPANGEMAALVPCTCAMVFVTSNACACGAATRVPKTSALAAVTAATEKRWLLVRRCMTLPLVCKHPPALSAAAPGSARGGSQEPKRPFTRCQGMPGKLHPCVAGWLLAAL